MRLRFAVVLAACLSFTPTFASADDAPVYPRPPKPDFSAMNFFIGSWSCSTKSARRPFATVTSETYTVDPSGYYLVWESKSNGVPWAPFPQTVKGMITYDSEIKQWAQVNTSSIGDYGLLMSHGWADGKLVWHSVNDTPYLDIATNTDLTITKVSDTKTTSDSSFTTKLGKTVSVTGSCTKSS